MRRPVERADEVLAFGKVDGRLAADRGVHLADQRRRHRDPVDASEVGSRHEARDVRRATAAEGDEHSGAVEPELAPEALSGRDGLRLLAGRNGVQRPLERRRVQLEHPGVGDDLRPDMSVDQVPGHVADGHAGCGEDDAVRILGPRVRGLFIQWLPPGVPLAELALVARERPAAALHAFPRGVDVDVQMDDECVELLEQIPRLDRAAAHGDDARLTALGRLAEKARLQLAERSLSVLLEELPDRALRKLDLLVDVQERPSQPPCDLAAER
jgi:hypothetical protein